MGFRHIYSVSPFGNSCITCSVFKHTLARCLRRACTPWCATLAKKIIFLAEIKCLCFCATQEFCTQGFLDVCGQSLWRLQQVQQVSEASDTVIAQQTHSESPGKSTDSLNLNQSTFPSSWRAGLHRAQTVWAHPSSEIIRAGLKQVIYGHFNFHQKKKMSQGQFSWSSCYGF